jgi:hypothetical protein
VPSKRGAPICLYPKNPLSSSRWTVYGADQQLVARLSFGGGQACFTETGGLAPGIYLVRIQGRDIYGQEATVVRQILIEP